MFLETLRMTEAELVDAKKGIAVSFLWFQGQLAAFYVNWSCDLNFALPKAKDHYFKLKKNNLSSCINK